MPNTKTPTITLRTPPLSSIDVVTHRSLPAILSPLKPQVSNPHSIVAWYFISIPPPPPSFGLISVARTELCPQRQVGRFAK